MTITIEQLSPSHLAQLHALFLKEDHTFLMHTMGFLPTSDDMKRQTIEDPDYDPALVIGAFAHNELLGAVAGIKRQWKKDAGFIKFLVVHESFRRQGLGRRLVEALEKEFERSGTRRIFFGGSSPLYLFPGVPQEAEGLNRLLQKCEWRQEQERVNLFVNLDETIIDREGLDRLMLHTTAIEPACATMQDRSTVMAFAEKEFSRSWAQETGFSMQETGKSFCSILRLKSSNEIIGFAAVSGTNRNWFGPMGVRADLRKQKLGHVLIYHAVLTAREKGIAYLMFPWINGKETFYSKFVSKLRWQRYNSYEKELT